MAIPAAADVVTFILTRDRAASTAWYRDTLGLPAPSEDGFATVFALPRCTLRITEIPGHEATPHPVLGWTVPDIEGTIRALVAKGVAMTVYPGFGQDELGVWTSPDGKAKVCWFPDPDGNVLSLTQC
ncbi:MAG: VOC family protein [Hyphomonadaceae bacterium]|nr:VOC family protein [Hyphomonadaceae bacterium]